MARFVDHRGAATGCYPLNPNGSPGGVTARGLSALEAGGIRSAFDDAMDAVLEAGA